jgi:hypothetical protein
MSRDDRDETEDMLQHRAPLFVSSTSMLLLVVTAHRSTAEETDVTLVYRELLTRTVLRMTETHAAPGRDPRHTLLVVLNASREKNNATCTPVRAAEEHDPSSGMGKCPRQLLANGRHELQPTHECSGSPTNIAAP